MNDLEMCKAIAKLEGIETHMCGNVECEENLYSVDGGYWPITDLALNCMLRDKHEVIVVYHAGYVRIWNNEACIDVQFNSTKCISVAVIECILTLEGLYK